MQAWHEEEVTTVAESKPKNASLWAQVKAQAKAKFDVYPSAYANAWAAKTYKSRGGEWGGADNRVKKAAKGG